MPWHMEDLTPGELSLIRNWASQMKDDAVG